MKHFGIAECEWEEKSVDRGEWRKLINQGLEKYLQCWREKKIMERLKRREKMVDREQPQEVIPCVDEVDEFASIEKARLDGWITVRKDIVAEEKSIVRRRLARWRERDQIVADKAKGLIYCDCFQGDSGKMVACSECKDWFHYQCLGWPVEFEYVGNFVCEECVKISTDWYEKRLIDEAEDWSEWVGLFE